MELDIRQFTLESWRHHVALVSQDTRLFNASLRENLIYGLRNDPGDEKLEKIIKAAHLDEFVAMLPDGLNTRIGDHGVNLSGGEKQAPFYCSGNVKGCSHTHS